MFRWLLAAFIIVPALEIWALLSIGRWIGGWQTFILILLIAMAGAYIVKREFSLVWRNASQQWSRGQLPAGEILDGVCILIGGALLLLPGFLTDILAIFLLLPLTRPIAKGLILLLLKKQLNRGNFHINRR